MSSLLKESKADVAPAQNQEQPAFEEIVAIHKALGDNLRAKVLHVLRRDSFGVLELCEILGVPQPALSHHLKILFSAGLLIKRKEGTNVFYRRAHLGQRDADNTRFNPLKSQIYDALDSLPLPELLNNKIREVHHQRAEHSLNFFNQQIRKNPEKFASQQAMICEQSVYAESIKQLFESMQGAKHTALEVGPGEGEILHMLAGCFDYVTGIDSSEAMLQRTRQALMSMELPSPGTAQGSFKNIDLRLVDFSKQRAGTEFNLIVLSMVLHHASSPISFFKQARKQLCKGGSLLIVELLPHDQDWVKETCGDLWLGFAPEALDEWASRAQFKPGYDQYLAQQNGFGIQIKTFSKI
ncbi:MAG: metalloregulator ArsR/SmtB family transcription factor [Pseudomonadales bacterium]|nr:metalloregulator ArsR/SmtB family transcription factor [Pseudomonadales bacterium]